MSRANKKYGSKAQFPVRLHDMMTYVESQRLEFVIGWVLGGRGFMIYDPAKLVEVLSLFFGQTKYKSFLRQLNMWDFDRILHGPNKGTYMHPYFVQGNRELCGQMSRSIKQKAVRARPARRQPKTKSAPSIVSSSDGESSLGSFQSGVTECSFQLLDNFEISTDEKDFAPFQTSSSNCSTSKRINGPQQFQRLDPLPFDKKAANESEMDFLSTYSTSLASLLLPTSRNEQSPATTFGEILDDYAHLFEEEGDMFEKAPAPFGAILDDYAHLFEAEGDLFKK